MPEVKNIHIRLSSSGTQGDAIVAISKRCLDCRFLRNPPLTCDAFVEGIPGEILNGDFDHVEPFEGDDGIQFEKKK